MSKAIEKSAGWQIQKPKYHLCKKCGDWEKHWEKITEKSWPQTCFVEVCTQTAVYAAILSSHSFNGEYIAPLCGDCFQSPQLKHYPLSGLIVPAKPCPSFWKFF